MPNIGLPEILIVLVIALVIFGPKRLPELGKSLGSGMRGFKDSIAGGGDDDEDKPEVEPAAKDKNVAHAEKGEPAGTA